jgi:hypothetical protein
MKPRRGVTPSGKSFLLSDERPREPEFFMTLADIPMDLQDLGLISKPCEIDSFNGEQRSTRDVDNPSCVIAG